tara:strand:- start:931 stop:1236 length:306 start_codon:yes stop_codon:yes gene_type:complete
MKIRKGDSVQVISGNDKGKSGRVIKVYKNTNKLIVEGINLVKKHARPNQENPQGGILQKEAKIDASNVMILSNGNISKLGYKFLDDGKKVRFLKKTSEVID